MFLTFKQLQDLTGYQQQNKQIAWLTENGYSFDVRSDGRPNVLLQQIVERQCKGASNDSKPVPNLSFLNGVR